MDAQQEWLLHYKNPLAEKLGPGFFKKVPKEPGVYFMLGREGEILYIGKAKSLRQRLRSYLGAKPEVVSRKVLRLVYLLHEIRWEVCESETAALLRENSLLREHRPPFNVVNTYPELYLFIGVAQSRTSLVMSLTNSKWSLEEPPSLPMASLVQHLPDAPEIFGAFKGRGLVRQGYGALLRLLWAALCFERGRRFDFPSVICRRQVPMVYSMKFRKGLNEKEQTEWLRSIRRFLKGTSSTLSEKLSRELLEVEDIPPFLYHCIQDDLETLQTFYSYAPHRNRNLRKVRKKTGYGEVEGIIEQDELDDLIVLSRE